MEENMKKSKVKVVLIVLLIILLLAASVVLVATALMIKGRKDMTSTVEMTMEAPENLEVATENNGQTVVYNGETYYFNEGITNILCIGVDKDEMELQEEMGYGGQADSLFLAVLDSQNQKASIIGISRDSMVEVDIYDVEGTLADRRVEQLCLSYAYGDGKKTSCENTATSVSRLLYGVPIHAYVAIDMEAIGDLSTLVGGVWLDPGEDRQYFDFSEKDGDLVCLKGSEAETFVRFRDIEQLESNNDRIRRQKKFLMAFASTVMEQTRADITTPVKLFTEISDDIVTSLSVSDITYLATEALKCEISMDNMTVIQGEIKSDGTHAEFYPDEEALYELILDTYYYK